MNKNNCFLIIGCSLFIVLISISPASSQVTDASAVPTDSLDMLQDTFARTSELLWEKADGFFHDGYYERSIALLRIVTEMDPTDIDAFAVGAWLMASKDREDESLAFLQRGLELNPDRYDLYEELAMHHYQKKEYKQAAQYYEKAVEFDDCPSVVRHGLAHSYERSGRLDDAIKTWEHIGELEPDNPVVKLNLDRLKGLKDSEDDR